MTAEPTTVPTVSHPPTERLIRFGVIGALAVFGQWALQTTSLSPLYGVGLYVAAGILFVISLRPLESPPSPLPVMAPAPAVAPKQALWITSLGLAGLMAWGVVNINPELNPVGGPLLAGWLASITLFIINTFRLADWRWPDLARQRAWWQAWWRAHWLDCLFLAILGGLAFFIRTTNLELIPYSFINDEGEIGQAGLKLLRGQYTTLFMTGWSGQPILSFVPSAITVGLFGQSAFAVRIISAVQGTLTVMLLYLLGRDMFDRATGLLAAGFLLALPFHVHFSRLGVNNVVDALTSTAILWLVYRAVRIGGLLTFLLAGLLTGLALYVYLGSRLAILLAVGMLGYVSLFQWGFLRTQFRSLLVFAGAAFVVAAPMAAYFWQHQDTFLGRLNREGILNNGWLQSHAADTGQSYAAILLDQFSRSSLVYVARPAIGGFFESPEPYLTFTMAIFLGLGLAYALGHLSELRYVILNAWFWSVVILGGTLTVGPPASQRLLMSTPALALLIAVGLRKTAVLIEHLGLDWVPARLGLILAACAVLIADLQGLSFYFGTYQQNHYFEVPGNELTYESRIHTSHLGSDYQMYLLGAPQAYVIFANFNYFAPDLPKFDFNTVTTETLATLPHDQGAFFLAIPSRKADLELVAQYRPGGEWFETHRRHYPAEVLYYAYQVPPPTSAQP